jgi:hypothetical protein
MIVTPRQGSRAIERPSGWVALEHVQHAKADARGIRAERCAILNAYRWQRLADY